MSFIPVIAIVMQTESFFLALGQDVDVAECS